MKGWFVYYLLLPLVVGYLMPNKWRGRKCYHYYDGEVAEMKVLRVSREISVLRAKIKPNAEVFFCESCGTEHIKWMGRCPACKEWNTVKPFRAARSVPTSLDPRATAAARSKAVIPSNLKPLPVPVASNVQTGRWLLSDAAVGGSMMTQLSSVSSDANAFDRLKLFSEEINRVLGGGLVKGSVVLLAGDPGIGKSTLLLQLASGMTNNSDQTAGASVVYISGEENPQQIALRAKRLGLNQNHIYLICDVDIDQAISTISASFEDLPSLVIYVNNFIDINRFYCPNL